MKATSAETSAAAIDELVATIAATKESFSMSVTKTTKEALHLAENRLYSMRAEMVSTLRKQISITKAKSIIEVESSLPDLEKAIKTLAEADVPNQEEIIMEALEIMSEIQEILELREHLLKMDRTSITVLVGMKTPPVVVARVMKAAAIMLGMEIPKRQNKNLDDSEILGDWSIVRKWLQRQGGKLFNFVKEFDPGVMTDTQVSEASELLSGCTFAEANRASEAAGLFYAFCSGMLFDVKNRISDEGSGQGNAFLKGLLLEEKEAEMSKMKLADEIKFETGKANEVHEENQLSESKSGPENIFAIEVDNEDDDDDNDMHHTGDTENLSNPELHAKKIRKGAFSEWESKEGTEVGILGDSGVANDVQFGVVETVGKDGVTVKYDDPPKGPGGTELIYDPTRAITDPEELKRLRSWRNLEEDNDRHDDDI